MEEAKRRSMSELPKANSKAVVKLQMESTKTSCMHSAS